MKKLIKSALIFLPLIIMIFIVNLYVDPASLINKTLEKSVAQAFIDKHNVEDIQNIDDRAMIEFYFDLRKEPIDCLVLGASRGMQISKDTTGISNTFNAGVTGAEFRDIVSIYYKYKENNSTPQNVILVLEPWTISQTYINKRCLTEGYYQFCKENNFKAIKSNNYIATIEKYLELFSIGYFQQSINPILSGNFNLKKSIKITDAFNGEYDIRHYDGSYSYSDAYRNMTDIERQSGLNDVKIKVPPLIKSYKSSEILIEQFDAFVKQLIDDGVNVTFFIPPILPEYYDFIVNNTEYSECFTQTRGIYSKIANKYNIEIIGKYNTDNLTMNDFYDVLHPTYEYVYDLFENYRGVYKC